MAGERIYRSSLVRLTLSLRLTIDLCNSNVMLPSLSKSLFYHITEQFSVRF